MIYLHRKSEVVNLWPFSTGGRVFRFQMHLHDLFYRLLLLRKIFFIVTSFSLYFVKLLTPIVLCAEKALGHRKETIKHFFNYIISRSLVIGRRRAAKGFSLLVGTRQINSVLGKSDKQLLEIRRNFTLKRESKTKEDDVIKRGRNI